MTLRDRLRLRAMTAQTRIGRRGTITVLSIATLAAAALVFTLVTGSGDEGEPAAPSAATGRAAAQARPTHVVPVTIDPTGTTDVTDEIMAFFDRVPDGSTVVFQRDARYRIEGILLLAGRRDLRIEGNGATFFATTDGSDEEPPDNAYGRNWPRHRAHWVVHRGRDIVLRNLTVQGANPDAGAHNDAFVAALEAQHGIELAGVAGAVVERCTVTDTYGDLVSVTNRATDVVVRDCTLRRSGRQGVTVDQATDVVIERNTVADIGRSAFDLEPARDDWRIERVRIAGNTVGTANGVFVAAYGAGSGLEDIEISSNTLRGEPLAVLVRTPEGHRRHQFRVIDNTSDRTWGSPLGAVRFTRVTGIEVRGNTAPIAPFRKGDGGRVVHSGVAVATRESCDIVVDGNQFEGATTVHDTDGYRCTVAERSAPTSSSAPAAGGDARADEEPTPDEEGPAPASDGGRTGAEDERSPTSEGGGPGSAKERGTVAPADEPADHVAAAPAGEQDRGGPTSRTSRTVPALAAVAAAAFVLLAASWSALRQRRTRAVPGSHG